VPYVQSKSVSTDGTSDTIIPLTLTNNIVVGNKLAIFSFWNSAVGIAGFISCLDGLGNVFNPVDALDVGSDSQKSFYCDITVGGACTITVTISPGSGFRGMVAHEVSGLLSGAPDKHAIVTQVAPGTGADAITTGNVLTTTDGQYIFGAVHINNTVAMTVTQGTGYNDRESIDGTASVSAVESEDRIQAAAGNIAATFTQNSSQDATSCIMTFKSGAVTKPPVGGFINPVPLW
jgi:hypothetical protein